MSASDRYLGRNLLLMGDFNFGGIDWASRTVSDITNLSAEEFLDAIDDLFLVQHVTEPTRSGTSSCSIFEDREGSTLDLIFLAFLYQLVNWSIFLH